MCARVCPCVVPRVRVRGCYKCLCLCVRVCARARVQLMHGTSLFVGRVWPLGSCASCERASRRRRPPRARRPAASSRMVRATVATAAPRVHVNCFATRAYALLLVLMLMPLLVRREQYSRVRRRRCRSGGEGPAFVEHPGRGGAGDWCRAGRHS